jgi:hypothetical protein
VRYEQLTGDPPAAFRAVCLYLGERYAAEALGSPRPTRTAGRSIPSLGGIVRQTKQWWQYLSATETAVLQERLAKVMAVLGYEPYPAG